MIESYYAHEFCRKWLSGNTRVKYLEKCMHVGMMLMLPCCLVQQGSSKSIDTSYRCVSVEFAFMIRGFFCFSE